MATDETGVSKPTREAIAFAFVAQAFEQRSDAMYGLVPLFAASISSRAGQIFSAEAIARDVNQTFDFNISPLVVEGLVPAFVGEGLLVAIPVDGSDSALFKCLRDESSQRPGQSNVQSLFDRHRKYAREGLTQHGLDCPDEVIDDSLLDSLTASDLLHVSLRSDVSRFKGNVLTLKKEVNTESPQQALGQALAYLTGSFVQNCIDAGGADLDALSKASWGALVSEVVVALQRPGEDGTLSDLTIFFDGPLLLDALDCGDESSVKYASDLIDLASRSGAKLCTFSHMLGEMQEILRVLLGKIDQGYPVSGPLADRIKRDPHQLLRVRAILPTLTARLSAIGVEVLEEAPFCAEEVMGHFSDERITSLRAWIAQNHFHQFVERDLRDARSVGYTLRMRRGVFAQSISSAGAIFVTRNPSLVKATQRYLASEKLLPEYTPSPCVSDRQLAGVLWFCTGGGGVELTRAKLAANCAIAVTPRTDLVTSMAQHLLDQNPAQLSEFEALIRDDRAAMCLVRETLGVASLATADNVQELFAKMRDAFRESAGAEYETRLAEEIEKVEVAHKAAIAGKQSEIASLAGHMDDLKQELRDANADVLVARGEMRSVAKQNEELLSHLDSAEARRCELKKQIIDRHDKIERATESRVRRELLILLALGVTWIAQFAGMPVWGPFATFAGTLVGLWWLPDEALNPVAKWVAARDRAAAERRDGVLLAVV